MFTPEWRRERNIRAFTRNAQTIIMKEQRQQLITNVNIALYQTLPQDVVSYIINFIPKITTVSPRDIRQRVRFYKKNYKEI
tara:strand:+ start:1063 stop:1305 length:243 start_codon:yes stop_codon:yes gene_type:complete